APSISNLGPTSSPNTAGWYNNDVTNRFEASDATSGLDSACQSAFPLAAGHYVQSKTTSGEGSTVPVSSDGCSDQAGNSAAAIATDVADNAEAPPANPDATTTETIQDSIAPSLTVSHAADGSNGWNVSSPVSVSVSASDAGSGLDAGSPSCKEGTTALTLTPAGSGSWTLSVSGQGTHLIDCQATDKATNQTLKSDTVKIDTTNPTIHLSH